MNLGFRVLGFRDLAQENDLLRTVPLEVHGDDADSHRRRTFCVASFRSAITRGPTLNTLLPMYVLDNAQACEHTVSCPTFMDIFLLLLAGMLKLGGGGRMVSFKQYVFLRLRSESWTCRLSGL